MSVFSFFVQMFKDIISKVNQYRVFEVPIMTLIGCFIIFSIVISVFWRGARG